MFVRGESVHLWALGVLRWALVCIRGGVLGACVCPAAPT